MAKAASELAGEDRTEQGGQKVEQEEDRARACVYMRVWYVCMCVCVHVSILLGQTLKDASDFF